MSQGWNFRIVKIKKENEFESGFVDARVYYNEDGSIYGYTLNPILFGEDEETLKWELSERLRAFDKPIFEEVGGPEPENCRLVEIKTPVVEEETNPHACFGRKPHIMDFDDKDEYIDRLMKWQDWEDTKNKTHEK